MNNGEIYEKLPPIQKILEAYTAIVDKHVNLTKDQAEVTSSNGAKTYTVNWMMMCTIQMIMPAIGKAMLDIQ